MVGLLLRSPKVPLKALFLAVASLVRTSLRSIRVSGRPGLYGAGGSEERRGRLVVVGQVDEQEGDAAGVVGRLQGVQAV